MKRKMICTKKLIYLLKIG